jgi:predicted ATPase
LRFQPDDTPEQRLEKLEQNLSQYRLPLEETVPLFATLLSLPVPEDRYPQLNLSPQRQRQKTLEVIVAITLELSERQPVLFILEDLHWTDPTTLEFLDLLIDQTPTASLCALLTCRPDYQPTWSHRSYLTEVTVNRLSQAQMARLAEQVAGAKRLPDEIVQQLVDKSDGVPLYVEEMTKVVLESGILKETNGHYELAGSIASLSIPATLQDSLMARLDRLVTAKGVAQYASVIGRQFSYELLKAVSELDETTLQRELGRLVDAELVYQRGVVPGATYIFKHALIQDSAYESLLRSTRQGYHRRIAEVLEQRFPETVKTQPELLAHHVTEAGLHEQAVDYWYKAGQHASERSAHREATSRLYKGLEVLAKLPETSERAEHELRFYLTLHTSLCAIHGYASPEVSNCTRRARELCQHVGDPGQFYTMMSGMRSFHLVRADLQTARELQEQILSLVQRDLQPSRLVNEHRMLGNILIHLGEFQRARDQIEQAVTIAASQPSQQPMSISPGGQEPRTSSLTWLGHALWMLGYPDQARQRSDEGVVLAQQLAHPLNLAVALNQWLRLQYVCGTLHLPIAEERAITAMRLATEHGFAQLLADETFRQGLLLAQQGQLQEGITQMQQGWAAYRATGANVRQPMYLAPLAEAYGHAGQVNEGLQMLAEALAYIEQSGERWWEAEIHRLKGELLLQQSSDNADEAESCFQQAISIAQNQSAKSWELRAATSLARLRQSQGKRAEARELLEPVYGWFTEGFDTADLIDAKRLLDELT